MSVSARWPNKPRPPGGWDSGACACMVHSLFLVHLHHAAAVLWQEHLVALLDAQRQQLAVLVPPAWPDRQDDALVHLRCVWSVRRRREAAREYSLCKKDRRTLEAADSGRRMPPDDFTAATTRSTNTRSRRGMRRLAVICTGSMRNETRYRDQSNVLLSICVNRCFWSVRKRHSLFPLIPASDFWGSQGVI